MTLTVGSLFSDAVVPVIVTVLGHLILECESGVEVK